MICMHGAGANPRPRGVTALTIFFTAGAIISFASLISLLLPSSILEPMWQLNPRAKEAFSAMGGWSMVLMAAVSCACSFSAIGLWRKQIWGYRLAFGVLTANLIGDLTNALLGIERRALIGVPITLAILLYMRTKKVRIYFEIERRLKPANHNAD